MSFFRLEMLNEKGTIVDSRHVNIPKCHTVDEALQDTITIRWKREAKERKLGFRVKREDD